MVTNRIPERKVKVTFVMHQPLASYSKALQSWHALEIQLQNYLKQIGNKQKILFPHINIEISETITFLTFQIKNSKT
jgi:hypothetical protein